MSVERGGGDHGRQLMNLHNNEAGRRVSEFQNVPPISDGSGTQNLGFGFWKCHGEIVFLRKV